MILINRIQKPSFKLQPENAYHIKDFFFNKNDNELTMLVSFF